MRRTGRRLIVEVPTSAGPGSRGAPPMDTGRSDLNLPIAGGTPGTSENYHRIEMCVTDATTRLARTQITGSSAPGVRTTRIDTRRGAAAADRSQELPTAWLDSQRRSCERPGRGGCPGAVHRPANWLRSTESASQRCTRRWSARPGLMCRCCIGGEWQSFPLGG